MPKLVKRKTFTAGQSRFGKLNNPMKKDQTEKTIETQTDFAPLNTSQNEEEMQFVEDFQEAGLLYQGQNQENIVDALKNIQSALSTKLDVIQDEVEVQSFVKGNKEADNDLNNNLPSI